MLAWAAVLGRVLASKYRLDQEIGAGAMGRVYRAYQLDLARDVAVKVLHPMMASDEGAQLRFAREAKVAARLAHPAAVAVLDYGIDDEMAYLVMELMEGETLRERMSREPLARPDALAVAADVADALIAAHEIRLIHRDIKPENIFLQRTAWGERVRVVDFGLAFLATGEVALGRMTQDGYVGGTPAYMAPEQVHGRGVGPAADIYGLGCMLYELIAGHPPFRGSLAELLTSQAYAPARPLRILSLTPPVAPELDRLVLAMLSKSAPLRPSPSAVWQALQALAAETPSRATAPSYISARSARALGRATDRAAGRAASGTIAGELAKGGAARIEAIARGTGHAARHSDEEPTLPSNAEMAAGLPGAAPRAGAAGSAAGAARAGGSADLGRDPTIGASSGVSAAEHQRRNEGDGRSGPGELEGSNLPSVRVIALGELTDELELGLLSAGCMVERGDLGDGGSGSPAQLDGADVIWAPGASDERLRELVRHAPVVTDLPPGGPTHIDDILRRLRAGAADLMLEEPTPDQLARKLVRAARRPRPVAAGPSGAA